MISEIKNDENNVIEFMDISKIINFNIMKCINLLFSKKGIKTNIEFYSFFLVIITYLVSIKEIVLSKKGITESKPKQKKKKEHFLTKKYFR